MLDRPGKLLIVDDDISIRNSLTLIFSKLGYRVRSAEGAFSALSEIRKEIPDVLLSDVDMAHPPDLEFLLAVRHWFPSIRVIAIGEALSSYRVPSGVAADTVYQKCPDPTLLIELVDAMTQTKRPAIRLSMEDLFGFRVFEAIPSHPVSEPLKFPANRSIAFPVLPKEQKREFISSAGVPRTQEVSSV